MPANSDIRYYSKYFNMEDEDKDEDNDYKYPLLLNERIKYISNNNSKKKKKKNFFFKKKKGK